MAGSIGEAFVVVRPDTRGFKGEAQRGIGGAIAGTAGSVAKGSLAIGAALTVGAGAAIAKMGLGLVNIKEQAQIGFTTMFQNAAKATGNMKAFGSASDDAAKFIGEMQQFAAQTPFEFPELIQASQRLMAMGFAAKDVKPTLTAVGDAVAALGGNSETVGRVTTALGQIQAKGKASADEMLQLTQAGIPAWDMLAKKIGVDIPTAMKMAEKGQISASTTIDALTEGMTQRFGGMMAKQSQSMAGLWSTAKDVSAQAAASLVEPFAPAIKDTLAKVGTFLSDPTVQANLAAWGETAANAVGGAVDAAGAAWDEFGPQIMEALAAAGPIFDAAWASLQQRFDLVVAAAGEVASAVGEVFDFFASEGVTSADAIGAVADAMTVVQDVVATVAAIAGEAWAGFVESVRAHGDEFRGVMDDVRSIAEDVGRLLSAIWPVVQAVIRTAFENIGATLLGFLRVARQVVAVVAALLNGDWSAAWEAAKQIVVIAIETAVTIFQNVARNLGPYAAAAARAVLSAMRSGLAALPGVVSNLVGAAVRAIVAAAPGAASAALQIGASAVKGIGQGLLALAGVVGGYLAQVPALLYGAAGAAFGAASSIGLNIVSGIMSGAGGLLGQLRSYISDQIAGALSSIDIPGFSPVDEAASEAIGEPIVRGAVAGVAKLGRKLGASLAQQVKDAVGQAASAAQSAASGLAGTIGDFIDAAPDGPAARALAESRKADRKAELDALRAATYDTTKTWEERVDAHARLKRMELEDAAAAEAEKRDEAKETARRQLADLTAAAQRGLITQAQYQERVKKILADAGLSYQAAGDRLGFAFAETFRVQMTTLGQQVGALLASLALGGPTSAIGVSVTRPGDVLRDAQRDVRERLRDAARDVREAQRDARQADTAEEKAKAQKQLDAARKAQAAAERQAALLEAILKALARAPGVDLSLSVDPMALWSATAAA